MAARKPNFRKVQHVIWYHLAETIYAFYGLDGIEARHASYVPLGTLISGGMVSAWPRFSDRLGRR